MDLVGTGTGPVIPPLFAGLCDDAAMFPPGNAPAGQAVTAHREHRAEVSWYRDLVGPFLVAPRHLPDVLTAARAAQVLIPLVLVVPEPRELAAAVRATMGEPGIELLGAELACGPEGSSAEAANRAVDALNRELFEGVRGAVEVRRDAVGLAKALDVIALTPFRVKYRTGGTVASAFPTEGELARLIAECAARQQPFKCTAGLHGSTRHTDLRTGFEHHGFLNILAAAQVAARGEDGKAITDALHIRSGRELADELRRLTPEAVAETRRAFTAYGTCSIIEPLDDLTALGLIHRPAHTSVG